MEHMHNVDKPHVENNSAIDLYHPRLMQSVLIEYELRDWKIAQQFSSI